MLLNLSYLSVTYLAVGFFEDILSPSYVSSDNANDFHEDVNADNQNDTDDVDLSRNNEIDDYDNILSFQEDIQRDYNAKKKVNIGSVAPISVSSIT